MVSEKIPKLEFTTSLGTWRTENMLIISLEYTLYSRIDRIVHDLFNACSNRMTFTLQLTRILKAHFSVYASDNPVNINQGQVINLKLKCKPRAKI